jgi:hypothetical protein
MVAEDRRRLVGIQVRSWLWWGAACVLVGTLSVMCGRFERRLATASMIGKAGDAQEAEIVLEKGPEIVLERRASAGSARGRTRTLGGLVVLAAAIFIYSMAR